jgi:hypothetical protein
MHQRLAARDGHHRRAGLQYGTDGLLDRHAALQHVSRVLDLAAAVARQVAGEQRFELDDQRELLVTQQLLLGDVRADPHRLPKWHRHY